MSERTMLTLIGSVHCSIILSGSQNQTITKALSLHSSMELVVWTSTSLSWPGLRGILPGFIDHTT